jgi:hypothetical protein
MRSKADPARIPKEQLIKSFKVLYNREPTSEELASVKLDLSGETIIISM